MQSNFCAQWGCYKDCCSVKIHIDCLKKYRPCFGCHQRRTAKPELIAIRAALGPGDPMRMRKMPLEPALVALYDYYMTFELPEFAAMAKATFEEMLWEVPDPTLPGRTYVYNKEDQHAARMGYQTVTDQFQIPMQWAKFRVLRKSSQGACYLLNDEVINFYVCLLAAKTKGRCHFFNCFFLDRLKRFGIDGVPKWGKLAALNTEKKTFVDLSKGTSDPTTVFSFDKLFFPLNLSNSHWALIVIFPKAFKVRLCQA
jgi:hypothetical protein